MCKCISKFLKMCFLFIWSLHPLLHLLLHLPLHLLLLIRALARILPICMKSMTVDVKQGLQGRDNMGFNETLPSQNETATFFTRQKLKKQFIQSFEFHFYRNLLTFCCPFNSVYLYVLYVSVITIIISSSSSTVLVVSQKQPCFNWTSGRSYHTLQWKKMTERQRFQVKLMMLKWTHNCNNTSCAGALHLMEKRKHHKS